MFGAVPSYHRLVAIVAFSVAVCCSDCLSPIAFSRQGSSSVALAASVDADDVRAWYAAAMRTLTSIAVTYTGVEELPADFPLRFNPNTGAHVPDPEAIRRGYPCGGDWFSRSEGIRSSRRPTRYWDGHRYVAIVKSKVAENTELLQATEPLDPSFADSVGPEILLGFRLSQCLMSFGESHAPPNSAIIQQIIEDGQSNWRDVVNPVTSRHGFDSRFVAELAYSKEMFPRRGLLQKLMSSGSRPVYFNWTQDSGLEVVDELIDRVISRFRRFPHREKLLQLTAVHQIISAVDGAFLRTSYKKPRLRPDMLTTTPMIDNSGGVIEGRYSEAESDSPSEGIVRIYSGDIEETTRTIMRYVCIFVLIVNLLLAPRLIARYGARRRRRSHRHSRRRSSNLIKRWLT